MPPFRRSIYASPGSCFEMHELASLLGQVNQPDVLVIGDLILDSYVTGNAVRVSQEAPVVVLHADSEERRLGGASFVGEILAELGATVTLAGVTGNDSAGEQLQDCIQRSKILISSVIVDSERRTTQKERFIGRAGSRHPHQMMRVDRETSQSLAPVYESQLLESVLASVSKSTGIAFSDYGKGVCTPYILRNVIQSATEQSIPLLIDPCRTSDWAQYRGAYLVTPNRGEATVASGINIESSKDAYEAGRLICQEYGIDNCVITLDRDGMALVTQSGEECLLKTQARTVYDITGAGDVVLAMLTLAIACGIELEQAVALANAAAGLEVEKLGASVIRRSELESYLRSDSPSRKIVSLSELLTVVENARNIEQQIAFTNGCFDLLHFGHVEYLREAAHFADILVVGVNSDASVRRIKGEQRPVIGIGDRMGMLASLECVDLVISFDEDSPHALLEQLKPDVLVKGGNYSEDQVVGREVVDAYGGAVKITGLVPNLSTTRIVESIRGGEHLPHPPQ